KVHRSARDALGGTVDRDPRPDDAVDDDARRRPVSFLDLRLLPHRHVPLVPSGARALLLVVARERLLGPFGDALRLAVGAVASQLLDARLLGLGEVEAVDGLGE